MVSGADLRADDPTVSAALADFELLLGGPLERNLGKINAFGRYWIWAQRFGPSLPAPRLFELTPAGIADLATDHYSLHVIKAGTWHQLEGLFGYWLHSDADHIFFQIPRGDEVYQILIAGGSRGVNRRHAIAWRCVECGTLLGEPVQLRHEGTPVSFLKAQSEAVERYNAAGAAHCPACSAMQRTAYGFRASADAGLRDSDAAEVQRALGEMPARAIRWNEPAAELAELQGKPFVVAVGSRRIALVRDRERVYAISAVCPHYGGPLGLGEVKRGEIVCPWHRFRFDLDSGRSVTNPRLCAPMYEVRVEGQTVSVVGPATKGR